VVRPLVYGSLFTGVGGFDLGFDRAGMRCAWQVEIDANCRTVLERQWPDVSRREDVRATRGDELEAVDVICAGFPCQDLSVSGNRDGLAGARSGLFFEITRIIKEMREVTNGQYPGFVVLENVPGLLSSNDRRDFACVLGSLAESGALDIAWTILDAQWFGVPQRRRRVFIVADFRGERAAEILSIPYGGGRNPQTSGEARPELARDIAASLKHGGGNGRGFNLDAEGGLTVAVAPTLCAEAKRTGGCRPPGTKLDTAESLIITTTFNGYTGGADDNDAQGGHLIPLYYSHDYAQDRIYSSAGLAPARVGTSGSAGAVKFSVPGVGVRRLTPVECERLQGFDDNFTAGQSDSVRYRQMGNAVAVPVAEWLGRRIVEVTL
jgi:DNA (cytosine-5)-methyltransferase 1